MLSQYFNTHTHTRPTIDEGARSHGFAFVMHRCDRQIRNLSKQNKRAEIKRDQWTKSENNAIETLKKTEK